MQLEDLRQKVLFNNVVDVWIALCDEKGWDWSNVDQYKTFLTFLKRNSIDVRKLPVCMYETGKKAILAKVAGVIFEEAKKTYVLRMDDTTICKLRGFMLA